MTNDKLQMANEGEMANQTQNKPYDIRERALEFAARTAKFIKSLPRDIAVREYGSQLIRSSASVGANLEEADGSLSKRDFVNKMSISRREARESHYWLRLIEKVAVSESDNMHAELKFLKNEAYEILLILSSIIAKTRSHYSLVLK